MKAQTLKLNMVSRVEPTELQNVNNCLKTPKQYQPIQTIQIYVKLRMQ